MALRCRVGHTSSRLHPGRFGCLGPHEGCESSQNGRSDAGHFTSATERRWASGSAFPMQSSDGMREQRARWSGCSAGSGFGHCRRAGSETLRRHQAAGRLFGGGGPQRVRGQRPGSNGVWLRPDGDDALVLFRSRCSVGSPAGTPTWFTPGGRLGASAQFRSRVSRRSTTAATVRLRSASAG